MRRSLALALLLAGCPSAPADDDDATDAGTATLTAPVAFSAAGTDHPASKRLEATWSIDGDVTLRLRDATTGAEITQAGSGGAATFTDLKSATEYALTVTGGGSEAEASGSTGPEVWQLLGTGADIDGLTNAVADSNAKAHAFAYGADAPADLAGRVQLVYGALNGLGGSLSIATSNRAIDRDDLDSLSDFTSHAGASGVVQPEAAAPMVGWIGTGSGVALDDRIRLYFESEGADGTTRIMSLDSDDGLVGRDFHRGVGTVCETTAHYSPGGLCEPTPLLGIQGDATNPVPNSWAVRQHKVGVRTLNDWRWDEAPGTFMVFTVNLNTFCPAAQMAHGYANWDGTDWVVDLDGDCPKLFDGVQAMAPLHLGGGRFKMQFGNPLEREGAIEGGNLPFLGPKRVIYGEADRTGDPDVLEYEDWDAVGDARDTTWLWPDGTALDASAEGYIDDFVVLHPTLEADFEAQYVVITDGDRLPFTGVAVLMNR